MIKLVAVLMCVMIPVSAWGLDSGFKIGYDGGSLQNVKAGDPVELHIGASAVRLVKDGKDLALIPASAVTEITYGQDVHRRVGEAIALGVVTWGVGGLLALSKSKKHFIGLTWDDSGQKGGFAFRADKRDYRGILTGLEGITGKKAVDSHAMTVKN
ncbi:hypothetical protein [Occallatibacter savannae]|uniref:hypothetical protein n=1 Tax=Occallatibacter savannae TaxID=1002691 RepID=UPI000D69D3F3|nr:hypothetical protein [Occallatibacter savannae]